MLFIFITSTILYRLKIKLHSREISTLPNYFHFKSGGNYSVEINPNIPVRNPMSYDFFVCTKRQFLSFMISSERSICSIFSKVLIYPNSTIGRTTGLISNSDAYQFLFYPSNYNEQGEITLVLKNPGSYLDSQMEPCLYSEPIFSLTVLIILIFWIINWVQNIIHSGSQYQFAFTLHEFITITYIVSLIYSICQVFELWTLHKKDCTTLLSEFSILLRFLQYWALFASMLLASKGWCIVHESISLCSVFYCIFSSLLLSFPLIIMEYFIVGNWSYLVLVCGMIGILIYYRLMVTSIRDATLYVIAHLAVIKEQGIDPKTTPVYSKYKIFRGISWGVVSYFLITFLVSSISSFADIPYYVEDIVQDAITLLLLGAAAYIFRLRRDMRRGYMMIGDVDENIEPQTFSREDVKELGGTQRDNEADEMREWEEGMLLPPQPVIVDSDKKENKKKSNVKEQNEREEELIKDGTVDI